jgi:spermidine synthase
LAWARNSMVEVFGKSLTDPHVSVCEADVGHLIRNGRLPFDAIVLDVDNGPQALTRESNDRLYDLEGLSAARSMLRSGGVLAVWSSGPNPNFAQRLRKTGFDVDEVRVRSTGMRGGARHVIWISTRS